MQDRTGAWPFRLAIDIENESGFIVGDHTFSRSHSSLPEVGKSNRHCLRCRIGGRCLNGRRLQMVFYTTGCLEGGIRRQIDSLDVVGEDFTALMTVQSMS
ncbi:hypothetical protein TNCV_2212701 [Trichonephila clavipes]|nr:hypothetical protein TNCV_2212701 [Trichonephila clavipes]